MASISRCTLGRSDCTEKYIHLKKVTILISLNKIIEGFVHYLASQGCH